jgi:integrase
MGRYNAKNERVKRDYYRFQTEAKQKALGTLRGIRKAIDRFEAYNNYKDLGTFNKEQAIGFKKHLSATKGQKSRVALSKSTILQTTNALKEFFQWLSWQPSYKSKIHCPDIEYFNISEKDVRVARMVRPKRIPSIEQIRKVVSSLPTKTVVQRRDRAVLAFTILTGMRDSAIASLMLKHLDLDSRPPVVYQEPDHVKTKFSKQITSHFFPVGEDFEKIIMSWVDELRFDLGFAETDPIFPKTKIGHDKDNSFFVDGVEPEFWSSASTIRRIFKDSFELAGFEYCNPHAFRSTLVLFGQKICKTPEQFKAWSQSLGHESPLTTFTSYGQIDPHRQGEIIAALGMGEGDNVDDKALKEMMMTYMARKV